jgi:hypothetical protein
MYSDNPIVYSNSQAAKTYGCVPAKLSYNVTLMVVSPPFREPLASQVFVGRFATPLRTRMAPPKSGEKNTTFQSIAETC